MIAGQLETRVIVKGRQITEFNHQGQTFIEGRPGSDFEIQVINKFGVRALAVISVDGLSIMDGKPASEDSAGYLIPAYGQVSIPGWMIDQQQVAKFTFGSRKDSYAQMGKGNATNCGVIGVMLFSEKVKPPTININSISKMTDSIPGFNPMRGIGGPFYGSPYPSGSAYGTSFADSSLSSVPYKKMSMPDNISITASVANASTSLPNLESNAINNLGTGFGKAAEFKTKTVEFEQGNLLGTTALYYDDAKGLKSRGIVIERPSRMQYQIQSSPNPFPASTIGCSPPKGWNS